jgi:hypothetical protein
MEVRKTLVIIIFLCTGLLSGYSQSQWEIIRSIESEDLESFREKMVLLDNINMILPNGYTILNYAILTGRIELVEYLLTKDVDVEQISNNQTPLMFSARYNPDILQLLIAHGADINREVNGRSALTAALEECNHNSIDILEAEGATVEMRGGADGPYFFYDTLMNVTRMITVNDQNEIIVDTFKKPPTEILVQTPFNVPFKVKLRKPVVERKSIFRKAEKIFAISDIEGNFFDFVLSLKNNQIIDENFNWTFGTGHLVLLGDFVDRGKYVTQVLWLIYKLEQEAEIAGGKVHYLLGNHEQMNLMDDFRFVDVRYKILAYKLGIEYHEFYTDLTEFGAWLRTKNVVEKIERSIFVHAGISDTLLSMNFSIPRINRIFREVFLTPQPRIDHDAYLVLFEYGVLWYRGFITEEKEYPKISQKSVEKILEAYNADRFVVGHTIVRDISTDYKGKIIRLDVDHYRNIASGILINGDKIYKVMETGEKELLYE